MKIVREHINESVFSCDIDDLYSAVIKKIKSNISKNMSNITVDKLEDEIKIRYSFSTIFDNTWQNLSDQQIQDRVIKRTNSFKSNFDEFKNFCGRGIRGTISAFRQKVQLVNVVAYGEVVKVKYAKIRKIFRYSTSDIEDLGEEKIYTERYGKDKLDELVITVSLFLREI